MGVIHGRDLLSSKWPTAIIIDSVGAAHFVPIKNPVGDYFFAIINNELYCFNTRQQPYSWRQTMAKTFSFYIYFTDNYNPFTKELKELDTIIVRNDLPRMGIMLYKVLKQFARREKNKFEALEKKTVIESLAKEKENNKTKAVEYQGLINFLKDLPNDKIVTPVRRVTEHLDQTMLAPDPAIFGTIKTSLHLALTQNREINHVEIKAKTGWLKIIAVVALVTLLGTTLYFAYEAGAFDSVWQMMSPSFGGMNDEQIMKQYPNCPALRAAVDAGKVDYNSLSEAVKDVYNSCPAPRSQP